MSFKTYSSWKASKLFTNCKDSSTLLYVCGDTKLWMPTKCMKAVCAGELLSITHNLWLPTEKIMHDESCKQSFSYSITVGKIIYLKKNGTHAFLKKRIYLSSWITEFWTRKWFWLKCIKPTYLKKKKKSTETGELVWLAQDSIVNQW